jgi:aspartate/methionine/tyrosine aminotransferase
MMKLSDAAYRLEGQKMFQILSRAKELEREGKKILHFELGDPDFDTPRNIVDAAIDSLNRGETHYTPSGGIRELKVVAAEVTKRSRGFSPDLDQLLVTPGANSQIDFAITCLTNPGDEVIVPDPGFVSYYSILKLHDCKISRIPLFESDEFKINPKNIEKAITKKTKAIIINSPSNPTGAVMDERDINEVYHIAKRNNIWLISDEIYARMVYKDANTSHFSPSRYDSCRERVIVLNGFSKSYAMTGWRIGVVTGPHEVIDKMRLTLETRLSCVPHFTQMAALEALKGSQTPIQKMVDEFRERRDLIVDGLNSLPKISCVTPKGAFYAFPNIKETGLTSEEFSEYMLNRGGVALAPGPIFGENGEGYVRMAYANSKENIMEGISRMREVLKSI